MLAELGLELPGGNKPEPRDYAELLESVADRPDAEMLQTMLLRSMKQAIYDPENRGHFGPDICGKLAGRFRCRCRQRKIPAGWHRRR